MIDQPEMTAEMWSDRVLCSLHEDDSNDALQKIVRQIMHESELKGRIAGLKEAAGIVDALPLDASRCEILQLTEQAWEEGAEAAARAIRQRVEELK